MATIQLRRGTAAQWTSTNSTLAAGEVGVETDTGRFKIGDGASSWTSLAYAVTTTGSAVDGGAPSSVYGGTTAINGGTP